jgi:hypothetical protein
MLKGTAMGEAKTPEADKPKIIVDESWKSQAQAEKERLAQQEKAAPATGPASAKPAAGEPQELPPPNFAALVSSIVTQILFCLGAVEDPRMGKRYRDLGLAKHHIDILAMLEEKTKGNLTQEEQHMLDNALYEVRMAYVQLAQSGE